MMKTTCMKCLATHCAAQMPLPMKLNPILFLISLLICSMTACGKRETPAKVKTEAQLAADRRAIEVRAAADRLIAEQNEAARLKTEAAAKKAAKPPKSE